MTLFQAFGAFAAAGAARESALTLITPSSVTYSGSSASIGTNGQVTFTACTNIKFEDVFSADYEDYMMVARHVGTTGFNDLFVRLRTGGTDATAANYNHQLININASTLSSARATSQTFGALTYGSNDRSTGHISSISKPYLAQPTVGRTIAAQGKDASRVYEYIWNHTLSTSYESFTIVTGPNAITGALQFYGVRS